MKTLVGILSVFLGFATTAHADNTLDGVDLTPAVEYFKPFVQPIKRPFTIYNWATGTDFTDGADRALRTAYKRSETFWQEYGKFNGSMYGAGLYGAADALFTQTYGGAAAAGQWILFEMEIPKGFKLVDLAASNVTPDAKLLTKLYAIEDHFNCSHFTQPNIVFQNGGQNISATCRTFTKKLFHDILDVDGIAYDYGSTDFAGCKNDYFHQNRAFVITGSSWVQPELVHLYTVNSTTEKERRIRIQSLFIRSTSQYQTQPVMTEEAVEILADYLGSHPTKDVKGSTSVCSGDNCDFSAVLCDDQNQCDTVKLTSYHRNGGGVISAEEAAATGFPILWKDLIGQPRAADQTTWLQNNKFGCSGTYPYEDLPAVMNGGQAQ